MNNQNVPFLRMLVVMVLCGCQAQDASSIGASASSTACKGIYYGHDSSGALTKFNQYLLNGQCLTDQIALTNWESSSDLWNRNHVACVPQAGTSVSLISANDFYTYENERVYLDLNATTGVYRRLILSEDKNGNPAFSRLQGCFYERNDPTFGTQLLLDTTLPAWASTESFDPLEIFSVTSSSSSIQLTRFDQSSDWDAFFCDYELLPVGFCDLLRNGSTLDYPNLTSAQEASLLSDAISIRKQFNYQVIPNATFESMWSTVPSTRTELGRDDFKYGVIVLPYTPDTWAAWRDFVIDNSNTMPDTSSSNTPQN